jgi:hypothetical protein
VGHGWARHPGRVSLLVARPASVWGSSTETVIVQGAAGRLCPAGVVIRVGRPRRVQRAGGRVLARRR